MTKRDLYNALRKEATEAETKVEQYRSAVKHNQQQADYWEQQAKCARGMLCRIDSEANSEEKR